ncbi:MAG: hypothetical protein HY900_07240, partial [Deltaproteobacteria bacterium]|nr:hypothetical protein [Deltaproteobacteria bacterium]
IGGMGSIWGSILGAAFLTALNQSLASLQDARALVFGMAVVLSMIFMPAGLSGVVAKVAARLRRPVSNGPAPARPEPELMEATK